MVVASTPVLRSRSSLAFCLIVLALGGAVLLGTLRLRSVRAEDAESASADQANQKRGAPSSNDRADDDSDKNAASKVVRGRVVDEAGKPVGGAKLWLPLRYEPRRVVEGKTDDSGQFELKLPGDWLSPRAVGSGWTIWAYSPGSGIATDSPFDVIRGKNQREIEIKLPPEADVGFKVLTPAGKPLAGALVQPQHYKTSVAFNLVPEEMLSSVGARTDASGVATLPAVEPKPLHSIQVVSDEFGKQSLRVDNDQHRAVREIRLRESGRIEGRLIGERPEWLRGVRLAFTTDNRDEWTDTQGEAKVVTNKDGHFEVPKIASGGPLRSYVRLDPSLPVRPRLKDDFYLAPGETLQMEIPLVPAPKVYGKVRAKDSGKPIAGAEISLGYGGFRQSDQAVTDDEGRFEGRALPGPVRVHIISLPDGYVQLGEPWAESYDVPGKVTEFELPTVEVVRTHKLTGRLVDDKDQPVTITQLVAVDGNRRYGFATTDSQGRFTMNVPDGVDVHFEVYTAQHGQEPVTVFERDPLLLRYSGTAQERAIASDRKSKADVTLTGRVLSGGKPLADVQLTLKRGEEIKTIGRGGMRMREIANATTDADGRYRLSGLKAGDSYQITMSPPFVAADPAWQHQMPWIPKLSDDAADEFVLPDVNLRKLTQKLAGRVVDLDGKPVSGATVSAMLRDGRESIPRTHISAPPPWTKTDEEGRFKLQQLPDEPLALMAYIPPKGGGVIRFPAKVNVELNQQDIRIVLDPSLVEEEE